MLELMVRLVASLAVVVGLMLLLAKLVGKRYGARAGAPVQVLHRQPLSRSASVAVVTVGSRVLVLGTTDQQVSLLTEIDPEELADADLDLALDIESGIETDLALETGVPADAPEAEVVDAPARTGRASLASLASLMSLPPVGTHRAAAPAPRRTTPETGALSGSVLSPQTWRQAIAAATGKAS
ncbi:flagellar protein FliO/FliZ [Nocardioides sp. BE266]|uniref:FliO/MopB family protein n=1 Tax=Nocardioides sp. BE266 TaxID=2817725 RepID=UPI00285C6CD8|nr:flagellar biosynthetic protein FliO [Nocardioides sp. BE266]MDR7252825.1 flagellar protein FliO/FliZ [Nocardioides sp. BE266]